MRVVLQKVLSASVTIDGDVVSAINKGLVCLVGFKQIDDDKTINYILDKIVNLRIFEDENEKLNLSVKDIDGEILLVPNFTIYGDARKGRRPSFIESASPDVARAIFDKTKELSKNHYDKVKFGIFQTHMNVAIVNDGPVTIILDSDKIL